MEAPFTLFGFLHSYMHRTVHHFMGTLLPLISHSHLLLDRWWAGPAPTHTALPKLGLWLPHLTFPSIPAWYQPHPAQTFTPLIRDTFLYFAYFYFYFKDLIYVFIYLFIWEGGTAPEHEQREKHQERERISSRRPTEPEALHRAFSRDPEIMTWAIVKSRKA